MAQFKLIDGKYYSIINKWNGVKNECEYIPLKTSNKTDGRIRHSQVERVEEDIKNGMKFDFSWLNDEGRTNIKVLTLIDVMDEYLNLRKSKVRESTRNRDRISLNQLIDFSGKDLPMKNINNQNIERFTQWCIDDRGYSKSGINISLAHIKAFLNWCYQNRGYIHHVNVDKLDIGLILPRYLNENELNQIYKCEWLDDSFKRAFWFYESTGCRPIEPFKGELIGDWLIVDVEHSKTKRTRQIHLTHDLGVVLKEMHGVRDEYLNNGSKIERAYERYSKMLRKVVRKLELGHGKKISLKSFRHTYAIKQLTVTNDIHQVARDLGHTKTTTTEIYLEYPEQRRIDDFPSLKPLIEEGEKLRKKVISVVDFSVVDSRRFLYSR